MTETEKFLAGVLPRLKEAELALHNGDATARIAMWSRAEPVTLFGAAVSRSGWAEIGPVFERLGEEFANCTSYEIEVVAAHAAGDIAYLVAFEHTTAGVGGSAPQSYVLRVTTIFRREDGEWKAVHRHGDTPPPETGAITERLAGLGR
jgi:ketosteroid isomerase-like protein